MALSTSDKIAAARYSIRKKAPYYTALMNKIRWVESTAVTTMSTTANAITLYNPKFVDSINVDEVAGVIVHEMHHLLNRHFSRCSAGGFNPKNWNYASDCEINDDLVSIWKMPANGLLPSKFGMPDGQTAEWYYSAMQNAASGSGNGAGDGPSLPWHCGSCSGNKAEGEETGVEYGDNGEEVEGATEAEINSANRTVARAIDDHVKKHGAGSVPGSLRVWAETMLGEAVVPWQTMFRRAYRESVNRRAGMSDYSWGRANKRVAGLRVAGHSVAMAPGMDAPAVEVLVAVDTSGSMGNSEARVALAEVNSIIKSAGNGVRYMSFDCEAYAIKRVMSIQQVRANTFGGGGTDFNVVFKAVSELRNKPSLLVIATDGCGPYPAKKPDGIDVVWLLIGKYASSIPWGVNIHV